jgi:hypothetical protein
MKISTKGWFRLWLAIALVWWIGGPVGFVVHGVIDESKG